MTRTKRRKIAGAIAGLSAGIVLALTLWMLAYVNNLAQSIKDSQVQNTRALMLVESCALSSGQCAQAAEQRAAKVIESANSFTAYVAACADRRGPQTSQAIFACVAEQQRKAYP